MRASLDYIKLSLKQGNIKTVFEALAEGQYKIPGLGYPYFTKLFYFVGQTMSPLPNPVPLIFDKWLANAYCALSIQSGKHNDLKRFYRQIKPTLRKNPLAGEIQCASGAILAELYVKFLSDFNEWSAELNVPTSLLEEFVFGQQLNKLENRNSTNPRLELWEIIKSHYGHAEQGGRNPHVVKNSMLRTPQNNTALSYKYRRLEEFLSGQNVLKNENVRLSIVEINNMLDFPLPSWAFNKSQDFWGTNLSGHTQKKAWMNNEYRVDTSELDWIEKTGTVRFYKSFNNTDISKKD